MRQARLHCYATVTEEVPIPAVTLSFWREDSLRIFIDTKAKVDLCDSSRGGTSRCEKTVQADDHDLGDKSKLVPLGILDVISGLLTIIFGVLFETSDFIVDGIEHWWERNKDRYHLLKQLVINLDNGPHNSSHRTVIIQTPLAKGSPGTDNPARLPPASE